MGNSISQNYKNFVEGAFNLGVPEYDIEPFRIGGYPGLTVYYVNFATTEFAAGISLPFSSNIRQVDGDLEPDQGRYLNSAFVHSQVVVGTVNTTAHELMHLLSWVDGDDHAQRPINLLVGETLINPEIGKRRRINLFQEDQLISIRANAVEE